MLLTYLLLRKMIVFHAHQSGKAGFRSSPSVSFKSASTETLPSEQFSAKAAGVGSPAAAASELVRSKNGNSDNNIEKAATTATATTAAALSTDSAESRPRKMEKGGTVGRGHLAAAAASSAELPYHYDALSVFRAKDSHLKAVVPDVQVRYLGRYCLLVRIAWWSMHDTRCPPLPWSLGVSCDHARRNSRGR